MAKNTAPRPRPPQADVEVWSGATTLAQWFSESSQGLKRISPDVIRAYLLGARSSGMKSKMKTTPVLLPLLTVHDGARLTCKWGVVTVTLREQQQQPLTAHQWRQQQLPIFPDNQRIFVNQFDDWDTIIFMMSVDTGVVCQALFLIIQEIENRQNQWKWRYMLWLVETIEVNDAMERF